MILLYLGILLNFAEGCAEAMPHVKGLSILNDSQENHKLLKNYLIGLCENGAVLLWRNLMHLEYPTFERFAGFVQKESRASWKI